MISKKGFEMPMKLLVVLVLALIALALMIPFILKILESQGDIETPFKNTLDKIKTTTTTSSFGGEIVVLLIVLVIHSVINLNNNKLIIPEDNTCWRKKEYN